MSPPDAQQAPHEERPTTAIAGQEINEAIISQLSSMPWPSGTHDDALDDAMVLGSSLESGFADYSIFVLADMLYHPPPRPIWGWGDRQ